MHCPRRIDIAVRCTTAAAAAITGLVGVQLVWAPLPARPAHLSLAAWAVAVIVAAQCWLSRGTRDRRDDAYIKIITEQALARSRDQDRHVRAAD